MNAMPDNQNDDEQALARLIVEALKLEGVAADQIDPDAPLFGTGLALDSLDLLEIAMAVEQRYGVKLRSDDPGNEQVFASLRSLCRHIQLHRVR